MGKFDGVLLASDFDNTLLNTEDGPAHGRRGAGGVPPEPGGAGVFHGRRREICHRHRPGAGGLHQIRGSGAHERAGHCVQRRGPV